MTEALDVAFAVVIIAVTVFFGFLGYAVVVDVTGVHTQTDAVVTGLDHSYCRSGYSATACTYISFTYDNGTRTENNWLPFDVDAAAIWNVGDIFCLPLVNGSIDGFGTLTWGPCK